MRDCISSLPRRPAGIPAVLAASVLACAALLGCEQGEPGVRVPDGEGLVLLPHDGPLARGVKERDPRLDFHDFGLVSDGETVTRVFQLRNDDPRPVVINRVDPGCGCTVASLRAIAADGTVRRGASIQSRQPVLLTVEPQELAEIEIAIDSAHMSSKNQDKLITVRVLTDSPNRYFLTLELHIFVERPFAVVPQTLALGLIPENGGGEAMVEIVQAGQLQHSIGDLLEVPEGVEATLDGELRLGRPIWTLRVRMAPPLELRRINEKVILATLDEEGQPGMPLEVPLTANIVSDLGCDPQRIVFASPRQEAASGSTFFYSRLAGQRIEVSGIEVDEANRAYLRARCEPVVPRDDGSSERWTVTLETIPPLPADEMLRGELRIALDDSQHAQHVLPYVVHLR